jgi:hypothetical protein
MIVKLALAKMNAILAKAISSHLYFIPPAKAGGNSGTIQKQEAIEKIEINL